MKYKIKIHGAEYEVQIHKVEGNMAYLTVNDVEFEVEVERLAVNPTRMGDQPVKTISAETAAVKPLSNQPVYELKSPLPGTILDICVKEGDKVKENQILLVLEAMKMENNIQAEREGVVEKILRNKGDAVMEGDVLLIIK
jgi:biotin carboxyl carrier protein